MSEGLGHDAAITVVAINCICGQTLSVGIVDVPVGGGAEDDKISKTCCNCGRLYRVWIGEPSE